MKKTNSIESTITKSNNTSEKETVKNKPISTVSQCRLPVFAPCYRPPKHTKKAREEKIITPWGSIKIKGDLTQIHRDVLDWIFAKAQKHEKYKNVFLFSPRQMAKELGLYVKGGNYCRFLKEKFEEMRIARMTIETDKFVAFCGIVYEHGYSKYQQKEDAVIGKKIFNDKLYYVIFEPKYMLLLKTDIAICYLPFVQNILKIKSPVVKAFIRFILSHKDIKMSLNKILDAIGLKNISKRKKKDKKKEIILHKEMLEKFGIVIDENEMVIYTQKTPEVYFSVPELLEGEIKEIIQKE